MPILSEEETTIINIAAAPINASQRDAFLAAVAERLAREPVVGVGLVHRTAAELQTRYLVEARAETSRSAAPRHGAKRDRNRGRRGEVDA